MHFCERTGLNMNKESPLDDLRQLDAQLVANGSNKHERVITLIAACAEDDIRAPGVIAAVLTQLGFNRRHVWVMLKEGGV